MTNTEIANQPRPGLPAANPNALVRRVAWQRSDKEDDGGVENLLNREWLVTNGLGGYASGTLGGFMTRRYHGLLVAALPNPLGRTMMLNHLYASVRGADGRDATLEAQETAGGLDAVAAEHLAEFRLELGLPVWKYRIGSNVIERRVFFAYLQNTVYIRYELVEGNAPVRLSLRPAVDFRVHDAALGARGDARPYQVVLEDERMEIQSADLFPPLRLSLKGERSTFVHQPGRMSELLFRVEAARGYASRGELWSPGQFEVDLTPGHPATLVASTEPWVTLQAMAPEQALEYENLRRTRLAELASPGLADPVIGELAVAADQFLILPAGRVADATRARAQGEELRTVIAGYHWFTDWGRDTMISLEGLTLVTGRFAEARWILRAFAHYLRDGLIPNHFPEGAQEGVYHTADATLWYFQALSRYLAYTGDRRTMQVLLPVLETIIAHHRAGTRFGIHVAEDGLLAEGWPTEALTWMDAKCADWVVTPRRGKPVEINALWYNALCLLGQWIAEERGESAATELRAMAAQTRSAFNKRFWFAKGRHLYDIVDGEGGDDEALRPNQLFAISLTHPVLAEARWPDVLEVTTSALLTPVGLRSLDPKHPDYKRTYHGDLKTRDAAYHQGTVWSFLIGPYVDVWLKLHPNEKHSAQEALRGLINHLGEAGVGSISEVFDAEAPYTPRGCVAQAWGVAELLRALHLAQTGKP
jgi:predicted glycogen debranching enzyme